MAAPTTIRSWNVAYKHLDLNNDGEISTDEIEHAYNILKKAGKIKDYN